MVYFRPAFTVGRGHLRTDGMNGCLGVTDNLTLRLAQLGWIEQNGA